jgi:hypothetical protein
MSEIYCIIEIKFLMIASKFMSGIYCIIEIKLTDITYNYQFPKEWTWC